MYHCVFCGSHYPELPKVPTQMGMLVCCPVCNEYKGLEECKPEICTCWELQFIRSLFQCTDCRQVQNCPYTLTKNPTNCDEFKPVASLSKEINN